MPGHANATAAGFTGAIAYALVWALKKYFGIDLSIKQSLALAVGLTTAVLWVGREGLKGAALRIWDGATKVVNGAPPKPTASVIFQVGSQTAADPPAQEP